MKTILLINGPNLNKLGERNVELYGKMTLEDIEQAVQLRAQSNGFEVSVFQSNHEGDLIDMIQDFAAHSVAIIINPGALSHYSYALHDAIVDSALPAVEVHLSDITQREAWRAHSVISPACIQTIMGKQSLGYLEAVDFIVEHIGHEN